MADPTRSNELTKSTKQLSAPEDYRDWMTKQLFVLKMIMGEDCSPEREAMYIADLERYSRARLTEALVRCRRECFHFPKLADIISRLPEPAPQNAAEAMEKQRQEYFATREARFGKGKV